jgi:hypothetical protein
MSTEAQIAANIANAESSTGPRTEAGKAKSAQNGLTNGLFAAADFIRPGEENDHNELSAALRTELAPAGILEQNLVDEIRRAMWRLRRCGQVEANLVVGLDDGSGYIFDPMESENPYVDKAQKSVDRARAQAHRLLHKCTAELRKLQTDRQCAQELLSEGIGNTPTGIADPRPIAKARIQRQKELRSGLPTSEKNARKPRTMPFTNQTRSAA